MIQSWFIKENDFLNYIFYEIIVIVIIIITNIAILYNNKKRKKELRGHTHG